MALGTLVCGVVCYLAGQCALLYLVAFVGDFAVPRTVSSGPLWRTGPALAADLGLLVAFGLQHSLMARQSCKGVWGKRVPAALERSAYVLASALALGLLFWGWRPLPALVWRVTAPWAQVLLWALFGLGWAIVVASTFHLGHFELFGLGQAWRRFRGQPAPAQAFRDPGLYRLVRHPLMLGFLLAFWAAPRMDLGHLVFTCGMTLYILAGTLFEERDLRRSLGRAYEDYRKRVPMLLPWTRRR